MSLQNFNCKVLQCLNLVLSFLHATTSTFHFRLAVNKKLILIALVFCQVVVGLSCRILIGLYFCFSTFYFPVYLFVFDYCLWHLQDKRT